MPKQLTLAGRAEAFNLSGVAYVGDLELAETLELVHMVDAPDDCVRLSRGRIFHVDNIPAGAVCALTFEAVKERFEGCCSMCGRAAVVHRSEKDLVTA